MSYFNRVQALAFRKNIQSAAFTLLKEVLKYRVLYITRDKCWCSRKAMTRSLPQKKILRSCFWEVNHWEKGISGGILFLPGRNELSRRRRTGSRVAYCCRP